MTLVLQVVTKHIPSLKPFRPFNYKHTLKSKNLFSSGKIWQKEEFMQKLEDWHVQSWPKCFPCDNKHSLPLPPPVNVDGSAEGTMRNNKGHEGRVAMGQRYGQDCSPCFVLTSFCLFFSSLGSSESFENEWESTRIASPEVCFSTSDTH